MKVYAVSASQSSFHRITVFVILKSVSFKAGVAKKKIGEAIGGDKNKDKKQAGGNYFIFWPIFSFVY